MTVSIIVAMAENGVIGKDGRMPWHISEDLKRFKKLTLGHPVIMGRKTYESIGKPLPGRTNIVITRNPNFSATGVTAVSSFYEALNVAGQSAGNDEIFVIGGAEIYTLALPTAKRIYLTRVHGDFAGDTRLPLFDLKNEFQITHEEKQEGHTYLIAERKET